MVRSWLNKSDVRLWLCQVFGVWHVQEKWKVGGGGGIYLESNAHGTRSVNTSTYRKIGGCHIINGRGESAWNKEGRGMRAQISAGWTNSSLVPAWLFNNVCHNTCECSMAQKVRWSYPYGKAFFEYVCLPQKVRGGSWQLSSDRGIAN